MEYEPEYDVFAFEDQCDDSLHASILTFFTSVSSLSHEAHPSVPTSFSLDLKPFPICSSTYSWFRMKLFL